MSISPVTGLNIKTQELNTYSINNNVEAETMSESAISEMNDIADTDAPSEIIPETADTSAGEATNSTTSSNVEMFEQDGVKIKITKSGTNSTCSCNLKGKNLTINAEDCTIDVMTAPSDCKIKISGKNVTSNIQTQVNEIYIQSQSKNVTLNGSDYDDNIVNRGSNCTINGGKGNDTIKNNGGHSVINGGEGDDTINNQVKNSTINGDAGNDTITNNSAKVTVNGGDGDDSIKNTGSNSTINGDAGNDSIYSNKTKVTINGGADNDSIINAGAPRLTSEASGTSTKRTKSQLTTIDGGDGEDTIVNSAYNVDINNVEDEDTVTVLQSRKVNLCNGNYLYAKQNNTQINYADGSSLDTSEGEAKKENTKISILSEMQIFHLSLNNKIPLSVILQGQTAIKEYVKANNINLHLTTIS